MPTTPVQAQWRIPGAEGEPILGDAHLPADEPRAVVLITHGFLGYKDYGMFPVIADRLAGAGFIAHRYNLSHSGMTRNTGTFERPDLFERDTWSKHVFDVNAVIDAVAAGTLDGRDLPVVLLGHSRGGLSSILAAAARFRDDREPSPAGIVTAACPARCCSMSEQRQKEMLDKGYAEVVSNRTGQTLRIGRDWLQEQLDDPESHDALAAVADLACPLLILHGERDPTVPVKQSELIEAAAENARRVVVPGADHVFNTPNPFPADAEPSRQLSALLDETVTFVESLATA